MVTGLYSAIQGYIYIYVLPLYIIPFMVYSTVYIIIRSNLIVIIIYSEGRPTKMDEYSQNISPSKGVHDNYR